MRKEDFVRLRFGVQEHFMLKTVYKERHGGLKQLSLLGKQILVQLG